MVNRINKWKAGLEVVAAGRPSEGDDLVKIVKGRRAAESASVGFKSGMAVFGTLTSAMLFKLCMPGLIVGVSEGRNWNWLYGSLFAGGIAGSVTMGILAHRMSSAAKILSGYQTEESEVKRRALTVEAQAFLGRA